MYKMEVKVAGRDENPGLAHSGLPLTVKFILLNVTDFFPSVKDCSLAVISCSCVFGTIQIFGLGFRLPILFQMHTMPNW